ncbi:MAG: hypothetical protein ACP5QC_03755 [Caldimicrobium sp.]|jgi:hypothetical protein|uniref:Uncharacterized protein n=1 Tax=Caldimicrobium thiodismutans TaxID=1653476 RepID=A0A2N7PL63_9BACT|nr:MAG: hypothetical protein C0197_00600 [Caldimicrobium thiodismutans]
MELKLFTFLPERPADFLNFAKTGLGLPFEEIFKLYFITFKLKALTDLVLFKFLERNICYLKFDEIGKKEYLLTLSIYTLRELLKEHLDLKFTKNLYNFLKDKIPSEFFKGCAPKREVITSQDIFFQFLSSKEKASLPSYLKVKHIILTFHIKGGCEELLLILPEISLYALRRIKEGLYEIYVPLSISEFMYFSQRLLEKKILNKVEIDPLINQLKSFFPDCFIEI